MNDSLLVTVQTQGGTPDKIELLRNGKSLATLLPPFQFTWDTTVFEEGIHQLQARAEWKGHTFTSEAHPVTVDRTGPTVLWASPSAFETLFHETATLLVTFTEPIRLKSAEAPMASIQVDNQDWSSRMTLSDDRLSLSTPMIQPFSLPSEGSASMSSEDITDLAGNPAQFSPSMGPRITWYWRVPSFKSEPGFSFERTPGVQDGVLVAGRPALAVEPGGALVFAVADSRGMTTERNETEGAHIVVGRLEGNVWSVLGSPFAAPGARKEMTVSRPQLALGSDGHPVVAFLQHDSASADAALHVLQWKDSAWRPLGTRLNPPEDAAPYDVALGVDSEGRPVVAWSASDGVRVRRWTEGQWLALGDVLRVGTGPGSTVSTDAPALSVDGSGGIFVAWAEAESSDVLAGLHVRHWSGTDWNALGERLLHDRFFPDRYRVTQPALATLPDGRPVAVWGEMYGSDYHDGVVVARWSGSAWNLEVVTSWDERLDVEERRWPTVAVDGHGRVLMTFIGGRSSSSLYASWYPREIYRKERVRDYSGALPTSLALDVAGQPVIAVSRGGSLSIYRSNQ
ncbi:hypothetical protein QEG98_37565 [Myxococcus sp. MxC21-1]|uniref:hypothetical protein n=1 Tax=Myxococcus sp. MxC21-1 TaxID=3041439 RepID=UPI00292EA8D6|nr:hypothetical protein [Myxococcus sp. MxC21-1]WNZ61519.1 hypothetical protein QEG98_37565 [Myxococcus sp. MxC21-1]